MQRRSCHLVVRYLQNITVALQTREQDLYIYNYIKHLSFKYIKATDLIMCPFK